MTKLVEGGKAPEFTGPLSDGSTFSLSKARGQYVVLYFYPEDGSVGCTAQNLEFTALKPEFDSLNAILIGISPDDMGKHLKFVGKAGITVPLLADPGHDVIERYGLWAQKKMFGKPYMGVLRETFIIDPKGTIAAILPATRIKGHAEKVLQALRNLAA